MRWRLQLWHMLIIFGLLTVFLVVFYHHEKASRLRALDDSLQLPMLRLTPHFFSAMYHRRAQKDLELAEFGLDETDQEYQLSGEKYELKLKHKDGRNHAKVVALDALSELVENSLFVVIWSSQDTIVYASESAPVDYEKPTFEAGESRPVLRWHSGRREAFLGSAVGSVILIGYPIYEFNAGLSELRFALIGFGFFGFTCAGVLGWYFNSRALRPIKAMSNTARAISDGQLSERISIEDSRNELGDLADTLNITFERLEAALDRQMQFTADASHELRTPLTIILNEVEWALAKERSLGESVESLETCQTSARHMKSLIDSLLELAKVDTGYAKLEVKPIALDDLVVQTVGTLRPIADQREVRLCVETSEVEVNADATQVRQVIINLVSNAIYHTPKGAEVRVVALARDDVNVVTVSDDGSGIKETNIPFIFDRFYRSGQSRVTTSGSGLGLAISKAIAVAHGGDLTVVSYENKGSQFTFTLPANKCF